MAISQLYPTQRPALDLNFARQKRLDSRVTFTRGSTATYVGSDGLIKTAASGEARFDHDPVTGESLGLLVEESRTNNQTYSQDFADASWLKLATVVPNAGLSPDGTSTASLVYPYVSGSSTYIYRSGTSTSAIRTNTIYAKASGKSWMYLFDPGNTAPVYFNLADGTLGTVASGVSATISSMGNGWYRCSATTDTANVYTNFFFAPCNADNNRYSSPSGTDGILVWGAQQETGSFPTSYIPTTSSTVTRSADVASLTNSSIYDTDSFTILNEPFGSAAGSSTLSLVGAGETPIKRTAVYSQDLTQTQINASVGKTDEFWRWRILGSSFGLPSFTTDGQVTVDWGDGTVETLTTSDHTFTNGGGYHEIGFRLDSGTFFRPRISNNANHDTKLVAVGPAPESMKLNGNEAFFGCSALEAFDATVDANGGTDFLSAWHGCSSLTSFPLIDTSSGTNFQRTWQDCTSLTSFPLIDTSSGTNFYLAWYSCNSLTSFPLIDTSSGTNFQDCWRLCSSLTSFPLIDTSSGNTFQAAWRDCTSLTSFASIDTSSGTSFSSTWRNCNSLTSFPLIDTSSGNIFAAAWYQCSSLTSFPLIDTSSGTDFNSTWYACSSLTSFPAIDMSSGTNFYRAWRNCGSLASFGLINTASATSFYESWYGCSSLTSFPLINTSSATNLAFAWYSCNSLTSFPSIDTSSCTNFRETWRVCWSLTSFPSIDVSSGTSFYMTWRQCSGLTAFPALNFIASQDFYFCWNACSNLVDFPAGCWDNWNPTSISNYVFNEAFGGCSSLSATSVENILNSIDTSGQSAPASGVDITIDYNAGSGTPSVATAVTNLKSRGWTITLNGVAQ